MYMLNIDYPTQKATLHAEGCRHALNRVETPLRGNGSLKRDGGWMLIDVQADVQPFLAGLGQAVTLHRCGLCLNRTQ